MDKNKRVLDYFTKAFSPNNLKEIYGLKGDDLKKFYFVVNSALSDNMRYGKITDEGIHKTIGYIRNTCIVDIDRNILEKELTNITTHLFAELDGTHVEDGNRNIIEFAHKDEVLPSAIQTRLDVALTVEKFTDKNRDKIKHLRELNVIEYELGLIENEYDLREIKQLY